MKYGILLLFTTLLAGASLPVGSAGSPVSPTPKTVEYTAPMFLVEEIKIMVSMSGERLQTGAKVKPGKLVCLEPDSVDESRWTWDIRYPVKFEEYQEEGGKLFIAMPRADVGVTLFVMPNDPLAPIRKIRTVIECDCEPEEKGDKKNDDRVNPQPEPRSEISKSDFLVLIEESSDRSEELAKIVSSRFWQKEIADSGYEKPLIYDKDSRNGKTGIDEAKKRDMESDLPFLAVIDKNGNFIRSFPMVKTVEELKEVYGQ